MGLKNYIDHVQTPVTQALMYYLQKQTPTQYEYRNRCAYGPRTKKQQQQQNLRFNHINCYHRLPVAKTATRSRIVQ